MKELNYVHQQKNDFQHPAKSKTFTLFGMHGSLNEVLLLNHFRGYFPIFGSIVKTTDSKIAKIISIVCL